MDGIAVISSHTNRTFERFLKTLYRGKDYEIVNPGDIVKPPYGVVIMAEELPEIQMFLEILKSLQFHSRVSELGGYHLEGCGDIIYI